MTGGSRLPGRGREGLLGLRGELKILVVKHIIQSSIAAFHNEGLQVFAILEEAIKNSEPVELSFEGVERCATQFLNAAIGKLYLQYEAHSIEQLVSYNYGNLPHLSEKIQEVIDNALHAKEYDSLIANATA